MSGPELAEQPYYEKLPLWPSFDVVDTSIDGLVPACRVESWKAFVDIISVGEARAAREVIYRGQRRYDWPLESTLTRVFDGGAIPSDMADRMRSKFLLMMRGRSFDLSKQDSNEVWAFGQHFGLATPLLDWTESPFVALFFAFVREDPRYEKENPSRAVFYLDRSRLEEILPELFFEPSLGENGRLVNQAGLFTVTPDGNDNLVTSILNALLDVGSIGPDDPQELSQYIGKIHIPNEGREQCLHMLQKMNIHHASLFPDPSGASDYCNIWLEKLVSERRKQKENKSKADKKRIDVAAQAVRGEEAPKLVAKILEKIIGENAEDLEISRFANRIDEKFAEEASTDWWLRPGAKAKLRVAFRRLLSSFGISQEQVERIIEELIRFYEIRAQRKAD
ncbi:FRG domain-containing protein [Albidovulum inexpectatum]|uniref:FRG domain-containing protein n=1 Tax=Albidovulum inexpectatum TaxID=196587 RepID=A0A2S5JD62_9RHOB|nr:FRG domain-containing protein [Albidovulum inexpectatum]PPB79442.1 FRG domain-containing protein [Albidovulum inexpectatum]